jgi:trehalose-phosphatase
MIVLKESSKLPHLFRHENFFSLIPDNKKIVLFLDYDGTLSPIVNHPEDAYISQEMRSALRQCAQYYTIAIVSGRDMEDVRKRVNLEELIYAGSHGFRIKGPDGLKMKHKKSQEILPDLSDVEKEVSEHFKEGPPGVQIERKMYAIAIHYRNSNESDIPAIKEIVNHVLKNYPDLKKGEGKKIIEIKPDINWHKGKAIAWILDSLELSNDRDVLPVYLGDDVTDEDAFKTIYENGIGILVGSHGKKSAARFRLNDVDEVRAFLQILAEQE